MLPTASALNKLHGADSAQEEDGGNSDCVHGKPAEGED
eukprot:CAMPEP_0175287288 /NCGR_PEP_ID=MMETSP0093-20121207/54205_1 /TAXON_ID=311494 /ORGANISM="Alexandrium monilatum, Strain CCMP3105" /LENGTH=37 /DNA_ID= /DNA_START= /DNA_END= /DNA_ORIENTATION=